MVTSLIPSRCSGRDKLVAEGLFTLKESPGPGFCCVRGCRLKHIPKRRGGNLLLCARHYQQRWRWLNPKQSAYRALKDHAAARKIAFTLTFDYFCGLTDAYGYWDAPADDFASQPSIDRVDCRLGYAPGNVRIISVSANAAKSHREKFLSPAAQAGLARKRARLQENLAHIDREFGREDRWLDDGGDPF
jgi:hypothetical protein